MQMVIKREEEWLYLYQTKQTLSKKVYKRQRSILYINESFNTARDITIINIYAHNDRTSKYMKQKLTELKGGIGSSTVIVADFNTQLTIMNGTTRQKVRK